MATEEYKLKTIFTLDDDDFERGIDRAIKDTEKLAKESKKSSKNIGKLGEISNKQGEIFFSLAKKAGAVGLALAGIGSAVDVFKTGFDVATNFEQSMANVAATAGNLSEKEFNDLRESAIAAGGATKFSAGEAADALNYMALAGFNVKQQQDGLLPVLNLAAAGNMDLATTSDLVTDSMSALGLTTEDLETYTNQLAKAQSSSNQNIEQATSAMIVAGGSIRDMGLSTAEAAAELGILADNGKKGAEGGTALRNVITLLTAATPKASKELKKMGVNIADSTTGELRPFNDILLDLRKSLSGMTEEQAINSKRIIAGRENIQALNILLEGAGDKYDKLTGKIKDSDNAAANAAKTQSDTVTGSFKTVQSALESTAIRFGDTLGIDMKGDLQDFAAYLLENQDDVVKALEPIGDVLEGLYGDLKGIVEIGEQAIQTLSKFQDWREEHGLTGGGVTSRFEAAGGQERALIPGFGERRATPGIANPLSTPSNNSYNIQINGSTKSTDEIVNELVPRLEETIKNM